MEEQESQHITATQVTQADASFRGILNKKVFVKTLFENKIHAYMDTWLEFPILQIQKNNSAFFYMHNFCQVYPSFIKTFYFIDTI